MITVMIAKRSWIGRGGIPAACLLVSAGIAGLAAPAAAATVDFESPLYVHDRTLDQVDGWSRSSQQGGLPENFRVFAEGAAHTGNRWMRVWTDGFNTLFRDFPSLAGHLDVRWRWRLADAGADVCVGVSSANDHARAATRALTCFHPEGAIGVVDLLRDEEIAAAGTWAPNTVYHMRMRLDHGRNQYSVFMGTDSLRADEKAIAEAIPMAGLATAPFSRIVVRSEDGIGTADVDDIAWETVALWKGGVADSLASNPGNWSAGVVPDSSIHVVFDPASTRGCLFDRPLAVKSFTVEKGYAGSLNLGSAAITVSGKLDLTGLKASTAAAGGFRLSSPRVQSVTGPEAGYMPGILHDGAGLLRLDGRALFTRAFQQTSGGLDLNGFDLAVEGDFLIQNGGPASLKNLGGRVITAGRSARLEGKSGAPLALLGAKGWTLSARDTLAVRYAEIQNSTAGKAAGYAVNSADKGGNAGWNFLADQVAEPVISPEPVDFRDTLVVTMTSATPESEIHYTLDGSPPDATAPKYAGPITLRATTVVKAIGIKAGMLPSIIHEHAYVKIAAALGQPTANPPGGAFGDSLAVTLAPPANAPAAVLWYRLDGGGLLMYQGPIVLKGSAVLKAIAVQGPFVSDTAAWTFTRRLEAPTASPKGRKFPDTLRISLAPKLAGAQVRYTLDGTAPTEASPLYAAPFLLDSTATLKAVSLKEGMAASAVLSEFYELVPDSLSADPRGGDFPSGMTITLKSTSLKAQIWYTLDGSAPGPENPGSRRYADGIRLDTTSVLKAVAVAGQGAALRRGQVITERYAFFSEGMRTLGPGQTLVLSPRYSLTNAFPGAPSVRVEVVGTEVLQALPGFRDVQFGMHVSLPADASAFPEVKFMVPGDEERSLYSLSPRGEVHFISDADTVPLPGTGTYFLGVDTAAPAITVSHEGFPANSDSTRIVFTIQDNVSSLLLDLRRSDAPGLDVFARPIDNPEILTVTLKSPVAWAPLWIKLRVDDRRNARHFPADPSREYLLARRSAAPLRSPAVFRIGSRPGQPWEMVSIPLETAGRLTLGMLKDLNAVKGLAARAHDPVTGATRVLSDNDALEPGKAIWMASPTSVSSLTLPPFQTQARLGDVAYTVKLGKGWTQIANPSLTPLIWPFARGGFGYVGSQVKGLHGFDPTLPGSGYYHADTLSPWKGYFVLNTSGKDTVITLLASPPPVGAAAARVAKRGAPDHLAFRMSLDRLPVLRLGALPQAIDGLGVEDEPQPPSPVERGPGLWSARGRARLGTDYLRFTPGALLAWTVVASGNLHGTGSAAPETRIDGLDLPAGYSAWAVSRARGLRFLLSEGGRIPLVPGAADSLDVHAGPAAAVEARLAGIPVLVEDFRIAVLPRPGGYTLSLRLPQAATLSFSLVTVDGKVEDRGELDLAAGYYDLHRAGTGGRPLASGMRLLRLDWKGGGKPGRLVRKLAIP